MKSKTMTEIDKLLVLCGDDVHYEYASDDAYDDEDDDDLINFFGADDGDETNDFTVRFDSDFIITQVYDYEMCLSDDDAFVLMRILKQASKAAMIV